MLTWQFTAAGQAPAAIFSSLSVHDPQNYLQAGDCQTSVNHKNLTG
jgi:hypothetical protein